jgi:hypothetical protein
VDGQTYMQPATVKPDPRGNAVDDPTAGANTSEYGEWTTGYPKCMVRRGAGLKKLLITRVMATHCHMSNRSGYNSWKSEPIFGGPNAAP